jgi:tetratricopeptide (TPR) repeat protein
MNTRTQASVSARARHPRPSAAADAFQYALKLHQQGQLKEAEAGYEGVLKREPMHVQANYLLGLIGSQTSRPQMAIERIGRYLKLQPNDHQAQSILALAYFDKGEHATSADLFERSLQLFPNAAHTWYNLGKARFALSQHELAAAAFERALALEPDYIDAAIGKANAERELKWHEVALLTLETAILKEPFRPELHFHYGNLMRDLGNMEAALDAYGAAVTLDPDYRDAWINYASTCKDLDRIPEALEAYDRALAMDPEHAEANYNKSLVLLSDLQLAEGWALYEHRLVSETGLRKFVGSQRIRLAPDWDGKSVPASLLVMGEQGLGDQIFFASMLADLQHQVPGATVCVETRLVPLLQRSYPELRFIDGSGVHGQSYDAQIYLGSLGALYRPEPASLERVKAPYLCADPQRSAELRQRLAQSGKLVCGLSWISKNQDCGEGKSMDLRSLLPVLGQPDIAFLDLQYGDTQAERAQLASSHGLDINHLDDIDCTHDIEGLAALIDACDIIVTVSNTTAHLAAALGKPVIIMLPDTPALFWYWHGQGLKSPWYPTACLFRKADTGSWAQVIDAVALTLAGIR